MKFLKKNTIATKQRYSEFSKLTNKHLSNIRGGEIPPDESEQEEKEKVEGE